MTALIIVDVQTDFITGTLSVPDAANIVPRINEQINSGNYDVIAYTRDWHPKNHCSFVEWPEHCVQYTYGASYHSDLQLVAECPVQHFLKGQMTNTDSYSGFGNNKEDTGLQQFLQINKITDVVIVGLALDYCVKETALDAVRVGYKTTVLTGCSRGVSPVTTLNAVEEMKSAGVNVV